MPQVLLQRVLNFAAARHSSKQQGTSSQPTRAKQGHALACHLPPNGVTPKYLPLRMPAPARPTHGTASVSCTVLCEQRRRFMHGVWSAGRSICPSVYCSDFTKIPLRFKNFDGKVQKMRGLPLHARAPDSLVT